jgi:ribosomal protein S18 acetylase RimI-like enzyme
VDLAQALLDPADQLDRAVYERASFHRLATLSYMERPLNSPRLGAPPEPDLPSDVTIEPYEESSRDDLLEALDGSYRDTLDCPGLRGLRRTEDILNGHQSTGRFEAHLWTMLRVSGRPAGVLLLNPAPPGEKIELVYLGLIPEARGRGLAVRLLRHGLGQIHQRTELTVSLAVDEQNAPAIHLYQKEGFQRVTRRVAMIRSLREARKS